MFTRLLRAIRQPPRRYAVFFFFCRYACCALCGARSAQKQAVRAARAYAKELQRRAPLRGVARHEQLMCRARHIIKRRALVSEYAKRPYSKRQRAACASAALRRRGVDADYLRCGSVRARDEATMQQRARVQLRRDARSALPMPYD